MYKFRYEKLNDDDIEKIINKIDKFEITNFIIIQLKYKIIIINFNIIDIKFCNKFKFIISIQFKSNLIDDH